MRKIVLASLLFIPSVCFAIDVNSNAILPSAILTGTLPADVIASSVAANTVGARQIQPCTLDVDVIASSVAVKSIGSQNFKIADTVSINSLSVTPAGRIGVSSSTPSFPFVFGSGNLPQMIINSNGNVGINTTTFGVNKFVVVGNAHVGGNLNVTGTAAMDVLSVTTSGTIWGYLGWLDDKNIQMGAIPDWNMRWSTAGNEHGVMAVKTGSAADCGGIALVDMADIALDLGMPKENDPYLYLASKSTATYMQIGSSSTQKGVPAKWAYIKANQDLFLDVTNVGIGKTNPTAKLQVAGGGVDFSTSTANTTTNLTMENVTGQIGIGTNNPTQKLHILNDDGSAGSIRIETAVTDDNQIHFMADGSRGTNAVKTVSVNADSIFSIDARGYDGDEYCPLATIIAAVDGTPGNNDMPGRLTFRTSPDGTKTTTEKMRITQDGNVGIGSTVPATKLDVVGDVKATGFQFPSKTMAQLKDTIPVAVGMPYYDSTNYGVVISTGTARGAFGLFTGGAAVPAVPTGW